MNPCGPVCTVAQNVLPTSCDPLKEAVWGSGLVIIKGFFRFLKGTSSWPFGPPPPLILEAFRPSSGDDPSGKRAHIITKRERSKGEGVGVKI